MNGFSRHLFWDCDGEAIDPERHATFLIRRVLERGTLADWRELRRRYSDDRLREAVRDLRTLDVRSLAFCSAILQVPQADFRCTQPESSNPKP